MSHMALMNKEGIDFIIQNRKNSFLFLMHNSKTLLETANPMIIYLCSKVQLVQ